jgi:opacity protein-like surface antigen
MRKRTIIIVLLAILTFAGAYAAPAKAKTSTASATDSQFAFVFDLKNLLLSIEEFEDGYQAGAGLKWWAMDILAVRGLANLNLNALDGVTTTAFGISAGAEWHPLQRRKVSPYVGGLAGFRATTIAPTGNGENRIDIYFGAMGGAEIAVWENLSFYAEYNLIGSIDANGFTLDLGGANSAQLGLLVYF